MTRRAVLDDAHVDRSLAQADAARDAQVFITMLPNDRIVHDVLIGAGGAATACLKA